jgi:hypothetical protein
MSSLAAAMRANPAPSAIALASSIAGSASWA